MRARASRMMMNTMVRLADFDSLQSSWLNGGLLEGDFDYDSEPEIAMRAGGNTGNADPYAGARLSMRDIDANSHLHHLGIFFSKDRREEVIEVEEDSDTATISESDRPVKLMTQSEWMKGCPEGGEQGFLFSLYNELSQGTCPCPNKCGYVVFRKKSDFFPILVRCIPCTCFIFSANGQCKPLFSTYVDRLRTLIHKECTRCTKSFCFACGEPVSGGRQAKCDDESMFHCPNLQGILLGVGLFMLERLHAEQYSPTTHSVDTSDEKARKTKRRKTASPAPDPEDYEYYGTSAKGKKSIGGIGYAGNVKEDVCPWSSPCYETTLMPGGRLRDRIKLWRLSTYEMN